MDIKEFLKVSELETSRDKLMLALVQRHWGVETPQNMALLRQLNVQRRNSRMWRLIAVVLFFGIPTILIQFEINPEEMSAGAAKLISMTWFIAGPALWLYGHMSNQETKKGIAKIYGELGYHLATVQRYAPGETDLAGIASRLQEARAQLLDGSFSSKPPLFWWLWRPFLLTFSFSHPRAESETERIKKAEKFFGFSVSTKLL